MSTSELPTQAAERPEDIEAVPVRHPGRWVAAVVVLLVAASIVRSIIVNGNFHWHLVSQYLFDQRVLQGVVKTLELTVLSMLIGVILGVLLCLTIIGIPLGLGNFKLAGVAIAPLGKEIVSTSDPRAVLISVAPSPSRRRRRSSSIQRVSGRAGA